MLFSFEVGIVFLYEFPASEVKENVVFCIEFKKIAVI
jgi:hypothetical protein